MQKIYLGIRIPLALLTGNESALRAYTEAAAIAPIQMMNRRQLAACGDDGNAICVVVTERDWWLSASAFERQPIRELFHEAAAERRELELSVVF